MKKTILVLFIIISTIKAQMQPGVNYMPHISFFDHAVNYISNPNEALATPEEIWDANESNGWYLNSLKLLGITNIVTDAHFHAQHLSSYRDEFFLNDMGFQWKHDPTALFPRTFLPARYMNSLGHWTEKFVIQLGGSYRSTISSIDNYGFGEIGNANLDASFWVLRPFQGQPTTQITGTNMLDQGIEPSTYSRAALRDTHQVGYPLVWAQLPWTQFQIKCGLKIRVYFRRGITNGSPLLFTLRAKSNLADFSGAHTFAPKRDFFHSEIEPDASSGEYVFDVDTTMLGTRHLTRYDSLDIGVINIEANNNFYFQIDWAGNADLYLDKITVFNTDYEALYEDSTVTMAQIEDDLEAKYPDPDFSENLQSFYYDEPFQLSARYRGELQDLVRPYFSGKPYFEVNGAAGGLPKYFMDFDTAYAKASDRFIRHYLNYNMYPIDKNTGTYTASIQDRLDLFINYNWLEDNDGTHYDPNKYKYVGLLPAQLSAQEIEVPLIVTLCVAAEQYVNNTGGTLSLVDGDHRRRPPTPDEIKAMGNISLAYGAKGFMYYMVPTRTAQPLNGKTEFNQYGLYEEVNSAFDPSDPDTWVQNPAALQVPNNRYTAVQEFIASTSLIDSTLLRLRWLGAEGWNRDDQCTIDWITNLSTKYPHFATYDDSNKTFVETGYFTEINPPSGKVEDAKFIYLVNRRCNLQPANSPDNLEDYPDTSYRNVRFYLNFPNSNWNYYTIRDLKTDSVYFASKTGLVTIFLGAGEGTLLKIEPQITIITQNDTLGYSTTFYSDLTVSNNATLTITEGTTLTFENHSRLLLSNGNLTVNGTAQEPVEFDFVTPYWQSTTNGIVNNYGNVVLNHAKIKNAAVGYYSYSTDNDDIQNSEIFNNQWGIVMHWTHSYGTEKAKIINCNIHNNSTWDNQGRGITLSNSSPQIYATTIRKNDYGLYCTTNSNPYDTYDETESDNKIDSNDVGIISYYSAPMLGYVNDEQGGIFYLGGGNTIKDNSLFNVKSYDESNIYVERDYWGTKDPSLFNIYSDSSSSIYTDYYLEDPPSGSIQSGLASKTTMKIDAEWMPPSQGNFTSGGQSNLLRAARKQIKHGNMTAARAILLPLLNNPENMQLSCGALELYGKTYNPEDIESFFSVLLTVGNRPVKNDLTAKALFLLSEYQTDRKETHLANLISVYQGTDHAARASYLKIVHLSGEGNRIEEIEALKNDMNRLYPLSSYTKEVNYLIVSGTNMMKPSTSASTTETVPLEYSLLNNYPNPFNPETMIKFSLKERSNVTLDVYNIAGQKVAELVTGEMEKGFYEKRFSGSKLSSGVYIFRLNAQSLESTTFYTKTMKSLLLK